MQPIHVRYIITCENVVEKEQGMTDFINVFDWRLIEEIPSKLDFQLVVSFEYRLLEEENRKISLKIANPENRQMIKGLSIELEPSKIEEDAMNVFNAIIRLPNFPVQHLGDYKFFIFYDEEVISKHVISFRKERIE